MYIEEIRDTDKCVGCGNCKNVCPVDAIELVQDKEGFIVPVVDKEKCINCKKCEKYCPNHLLKYKEIDNMPEVAIVRAKEHSFLYESASGGICTLLAEYIVKKLKGYVCGAIYDSDFSVIHILSNDIKDLEKMRQSKYVQSDLKKCFKEIETRLENDEYVLFIGTTCQNYALKKYLKADYEKLFCIDLICHGVPSPLVQKEYVKYLEEKNGKLSRLNNRHKKLYAHSYVSTYNAEFSNGKKVTRRYSDDPMASAFFSHLSIRKSCFDCSFKTIHRITDLTVGDFWFSEQYGFGEDTLGVNLCLLQSDKGKCLLDSISEQIDIKQIDATEAIVLNGGMLYSSCKENKNRKEFFEQLGKDRFDRLVKKYAEQGGRKRVKNCIREWIAPILRSTKYYNKQLIRSAEIRKKKEVPRERCGVRYYE